MAVALAVAQPLVALVGGQTTPPRISTPPRSAAPPVAPSPIAPPAAPSPIASAAVPPPSPAASAAPQALETAEGSVTGSRDDRGSCGPLNYWIRTTGGLTFQFCLGGGMPPPGQRWSRMEVTVAAPPKGLHVTLRAPHLLPDRNGDCADCQLTYWLRSDDEHIVAALTSSKAAQRRRMAVALQYAPSRLHARAVGDAVVAHLTDPEPAVSLHLMAALFSSGEQRADAAAALLEIAKGQFNDGRTGVAVLALSRLANVLGGAARAEVEALARGGNRWMEQEAVLVLLHERPLTRASARLGAAMLRRIAADPHESVDLDLLEALDALGLPQAAQMRREPSDCPSCKSWINEMAQALERWP